MKKFTDILTCVLFCGFLGLMLVLFLVTPHQETSELEKKALQDPPELEQEAVLSGQYGKEAEDYIAEQLPGRSFFVGVNAYYDLWSGRQGTKDILLAEGGRLVEKPNTFDKSAIAQKMGIINAFSQTVSQPVDLMIVPSSGYMVRREICGVHDAFTDDAILAHAYSQAGENVRPVDLLTAFAAEEPGKLYYRTDHHWTSLGAYKAYAAYMEGLGKAYPAQNVFAVEGHSGFYGTTYSRSGLWLTEPDMVELWDGGKALTVTIQKNRQDPGTTHDGLFYREHLEAMDMYPVYLDGIHPIVRVQNPQGQGKILVIRDSYASCLGTFLANSYAEVVLVDLRYLHDRDYPISKMVAEEGFDQILVCYSLNNFLTDSNFGWLQ